MRISRWYALLAVALVASLVLVPTVAFAAGLLTNEWGQSFFGSGATTPEKDGCIQCHNNEFGSIDYNATSHGQFAKFTTATIEPNQASGMWGGQVLRNAIDPAKVFSLGAGTGLREYILFGAGTAGKFGVPTLEWDPSEPSLWEVAGNVNMTIGDYGCNQCHMLGATKKDVVPPIPGAAAGTANSWATEVGADLNAQASYIPGLGIQCERCHGTGVASETGAHYFTGVKVVGYNNAGNVSSERPVAFAKVASGDILKSEVCGQCHGSFVSGNIAGYTPDRNINDFVVPFTLADVPTEDQFLADIASIEATTNNKAALKYKFFPNGQNSGIVVENANGTAKAGGNKHVYYTEWALSGHSVRGFYGKAGAITTDAAGASLITPYQKSGASHYDSQAANRLYCNRCHTGEGYLKRKGAKIMDGWTEGVDAAGKIGQECAVCHISHGNVGATDTDSAVEENEAIGMAVRSPEKANGQFSTVGLAVDNKSICEDCHNWQREVANAGAAPSLAATPTIESPVSKYVSHPTREIYHGRAMLEIAPAEDFMRGAKCEQCHMPATRSDFPEKTGRERYADRSWKRYSHRMFIMMPGDAEAWGLAPWGDSCSPCHAGETQSELQDNIDKWQTTATTLVDAATAQITAAINRGDVTSKGDVDLLKRAAANVSLVQQDGSMGVHNPPYEQAGLKKAAELAKSAGGSITMSAPVRVASGALFGIAGMVKNGDGSAAAGVTVKLYEGTTVLGTAVTDANGNYGFAYAQTAAKTYTVKWARSSQAVSDLAVSATVAADTAKVATTLDLSLSRSSVTRGTSYKISGKISPAFAGASIVLSYKLPGRTSYVKFTTLKTSSTGAFSITKTTGRTTTRGTWTWKVSYAGDSTHLGSSDTAKIVVR